MLHRRRFLQQLKASPPPRPTKRAALPPAPPSQAISAAPRDAERQRPEQVLGDAMPEPHLSPLLRGRLEQAEAPPLPPDLGTDEASSARRLFDPTELTRRPRDFAASQSMRRRADLLLQPLHPARLARGLERLLRAGRTSAAEALGVVQQSGGLVLLMALGLQLWFWAVRLAPALPPVQLAEPEPPSSLVYSRLESPSNLRWADVRSGLIDLMQAQGPLALTSAQRAVASQLLGGPDLGLLTRDNAASITRFLDLLNPAQRRLLASACITRRLRVQRGRADG